MSDITSLFKATIKVVKQREQALLSMSHQKYSQSNLEDSSDCIKVQFKLDNKDGSRILHKSEFSSQALNVVSNIKQLQDFLLKYRKDYINASGHLVSQQCKLTDVERDQIDLDAESYIKGCADALRQLRVNANTVKVLRQVKEHKDAVLDVIDKYLYSVCQIYSEQKAIRVKRIVDLKRIARLENRSTSQSFNQTQMENKTDLSSTIQSNSNSTNKIEETKSTFQELYSTEDDLTAEEEHQLQLENEQVFEEMNGIVDEVRQIEGKLVEISRLQEIFAEQVLQQEGDIKKVSDIVVGSTENIKDANEEIREALKNNAGFRIWILFFLIMCSFSLLFLDWYNA